VRGFGVEGIERILPREGDAEAAEEGDDEDAEAGLEEAILAGKVTVVDVDGGEELGQHLAAGREATSVFARTSDEYHSKGGHGAGRAAIRLAWRKCGSACAAEERD
jgi:hypothetical protein